MSEPENEGTCKNATQAAVAVLLETGRDIWGDSETRCEDLPIRLAVMVGDIARVVRDADEARAPVDQDEIAKELGNFVLSAIRWADDLGLDPVECIELAAEAQRRYVAKQEARTATVTEALIHAFLGSADPIPACAVYCAPQDFKSWDVVTCPDCLALRPRL